MAPEGSNSATLGTAETTEAPPPWSWPWIRERPQTYGFMVVMVILFVCVVKNLIQRRGSNKTLQRTVELAMYIATLIGACHMLLNAIAKPASELGEGAWPMIFGFFMLMAFALPRIYETLGVMWTGDDLGIVQPTLGRTPDASAEGSPSVPTDQAAQNRTD